MAATGLHQRTIAGVYAGDPKSREASVRLTKAAAERLGLPLPPERGAPAHAAR